MSRGVVICICVALAGVVLCVVGIVRAGDTGEVVAGYPAVDAGSSIEMQLDEGDDMVGYYESTCFGCEGRESVSPAPRLRIAAVDGGAVAVRPYRDRATARYSPSDLLAYTEDGFDGSPAYDVGPLESGTYRIALGASPDPDARVRIGPDLRTRKIVGIALAVAGFLLSGAAVLTLGAWWISVMLRDATRDG